MKKIKLVTKIYLVIGLLIIGGLYLMIGWTDTNLEWLFTAIKGTPVIIPNWLSAIATFAFNGFAFLFNVICEILKLVF